MYVWNEKLATKKTNIKHKIEMMHVLYRPLFLLYQKQKKEFLGIINKSSHIIIIHIHIFKLYEEYCHNIFGSSNFKAVEFLRL